jgi:hypothetical protein
VVQGDVNDPDNVRRALINITQQLQTVSSGGRDAFGFVNIQIRVLAAERRRLQLQLADAQATQMRSVTEAIVNTFIGQGLTGEDLTQAVADALAVRRRYGLDSTGTTSQLGGFNPIQSGIF